MVTRSFIDGVDLAFGNDVNTLNRGLNPTASGESHRFCLSACRWRCRTTLVATSVTIQPVPMNWCDRYQQRQSRLSGA